MRQYTRELYSTVLEEETGQSTGFQPIGFIEVATSPDRLEEYRRVAAFNRYMGVDVHEISPEEVKRMWFVVTSSSGTLHGLAEPCNTHTHKVTRWIAQQTPS